MLSRDNLKALARVTNHQQRRRAKAADAVHTKLRLTEAAGMSERGGGGEGGEGGGMG